MYWNIVNSATCGSQNQVAVLSTVGVCAGRRGGESQLHYRSCSLAPVMSGKTGGVSALAAADATRVKANRNPDFNKVLESRKNADIIEYLNSNGNEEQKKRDFQVSFSSVKLKSSLDEDISHPQHHPLACICVFPHILSVQFTF